MRKVLVKRDVKAEEEEGEGENANVTRLGLVESYRRCHYCRLHRHICMMMMIGSVVLARICEYICDIKIQSIYIILLYFIL